MNKQSLKRLIDVAAGRTPADLRLKNCRVIDVFNKCIFDADVLITEGLIAGYGAEGFPEAAETYDAKGSYLAPAFIDSHVHIESSHLSPAEFSRLIVPHGTTTVVADPHEICNVCGLEGFDYMLKASEKIALQVFLQLPSCVPCTPFENAGATLSAKEIAQRIRELGDAAHSALGVHPEVDPFMALCFMALPVIPQLKITDTGLFDVNAFRTVPVELD